MTQFRLKLGTIGFLCFTGFILLTYGLVTYNRYLRLEYDLVIRDAVSYLGLGPVCLAASAMLGFLTL